MIILFDLDGTVIDSTEAILESFHYACDLHQTPRLDEGAIKNMIGHPLSEMFASLGVEAEKVQSHVNHYKEHYRTIATQKTILLPGAAQAVREASEFARLGVVTTKTGKYSIEILEHLGLWHYFETLIGFEHVTNPKPHPEPVLKALENMGCGPSGAWLIGDTRMDVFSAKAAGIECVAVSSGYEGAASLSEVTDLIKDNVLEAVGFLKEKHREPLL